METSANNDDREKVGKEFSIVFSILLFLVNIIFFWHCYSRGGWAQLGLLIIAPMYNGLFMLAGIITAFRLGKKHPQSSISWVWFCVIFLPILLLIASIILTLGFPRGSGC